MSKIAAVLLALVFFLPSCGGDDGEDTSGETKENKSSESTTPEPDPADQAIAESSLLTLQDFPAGWEAEPADDDEDSSLDKDALAECVGVEYDELYDDSAAEAESRTFISPQDEEIDHEVGIASDEEWTRSVFEITSGDKWRNCVAEQMQSSIADAVKKEDKDAKVGDVTVNEMGFESFGDETTAMRVTIPLEVNNFNIEASLDFVAVRVGRAMMIVTASSVGTGLSADELAEFVDIAVKRLDQELATP
jgi:hypothetical protein